MPGLSLKLKACNQIIEPDTLDFEELKVLDKDAFDILVCFSWAK